MDGVLNSEMSGLRGLMNDGRKSKLRGQWRKATAKQRKKPNSAARSSFYSRKHRYGISEEEINKMYAEQEGKCYFCGKHKPLYGKRGNQLCVDHSHKTGKPRRLLCRGCNNKMAAIDDEEFLKKALIYKAQFG